MTFRGAFVALAGMSVSALPLAAQDVVDAGNIQLQNWSYQDLYDTDLRSVDSLFGTAVHDTDGAEIGDVEDLVMTDAGEVVALIAEVGGFWDIGDTHVSVPWDSVEFGADGTVTVPVTQETIDDYDLFATAGLPEGADLSGDVVGSLDDEPLGSRYWRASELVGDYVRVRDEAAQWANLGYVSDIMLDGDTIAATLVTTTPRYGPGTYAYPYGTNGRAPDMEPVTWYPERRTQDLPVLMEDATSLDLFEQDGAESN